MVDNLYPAAQVRFVRPTGTRDFIDGSEERLA